MENVQNKPDSLPHDAKYYRRDIDGLRAIAVISIVLFHLDNAWMPGGFAGVDIFFVISGYLISGIIYQQAIPFSFTDFYVRRTLRILPALTAVLLATLVLAMLTLYPQERVGYAGSAIASSLFFANNYFFSVLNYFSPNADEIPLLHLWSLGIEEQFYLCFPLLIAGTGWLFKRTARAVPRQLSGAAAPVGHLFIPLVSLWLVSLLASVWMLKLDPSAAFYLLPFRAFELLTGSVLALGVFRFPLKPGPANLLFSGGLLMLVLVLVLFSRLTAFPGMAAMLPCIATALLIHAGHAAHASQKEGQNKADKFYFSSILEWNGLSYIGRISFSLYLVHWPVIVFGKRYFPDLENSRFAAGALLLSLALAALSYQFIEQPFRKLNGKIRPGTIFGIAAFAILLTIGLNGIVVLKHGFPDMSDNQINKVDAFINYDFNKAFHARSCFLDPDQKAVNVNLGACLPVQKDNDVILWGDSHAAHLADALHADFQRNKETFGFIAASACAPAMGYNPAVRPQCQGFNDVALRLILNRHPKMLILSAVWHFDDPTLGEGLDQTLKILVQHGIHVVILGNSPIYKHSVPVMIVDRLKAKEYRMRTSDGLEEALLTSTEKTMKQRYGHLSGAIYLSMLDRFCPDMQCPLTTPDGTPVHFDSEHFTFAGAEMAAKLVMPDLLSAMAQ